MSSILFVAGAVMYGWDATGHMLALALPRDTYNSLYPFIPRFTDFVTFNLFWSYWHSAALSLMAIGFWMAKRSPSDVSP